MITEEEEEEKEEEDGYVCSTNGRSYRSICRMLQDTAFTTQVAHLGRCNARACRDGPVSDMYCDSLLFYIVVCIMYFVGTQAHVQCHWK